MQSRMRIRGIMGGDLFLVTTAPKKVDGAYRMYGGLGSMSHDKEGRVS